MTIFASRLRSFFSGSKLASTLQIYFRSGWAFLIPYLAAYLLYAWLKWPVNPVDATNPQLSALGSQPAAPLLRPPCLLHVYWILHALHLLFAILALITWWRNPGHSVLNPQPAPDAQSAWHPLHAALPWLCLALIFWIPGVYLEWPSDPWEHLRRINEWRGIEMVTAHSSWIKSSYFIPYSLLNCTRGLRQIYWLDFYYAGICLLLCWQYYRLARACDLGKHSSMVFVILQALLLGNNIFSFYRYYGISSSLYAQLGAVALTRIGLEAAKGLPLSWRAYGRPQTSAALPRPATVYGLLLSSSLLLAVIAFNHQQGFGIAGLGIAAIAVWRLVKWNGSALWWLIGATVIGNALFLWIYPRPTIVESYRAQGYLNAWYGFDLLDLTSPAGDRALQIVSILGLVNLVAALFLSRRNHVIFWLTCLPPVALLLPACAIPFAQVIAQQGDGANIVTFQRMFFSIPPCLALACLGANLLESRKRGGFGLHGPVVAQSDSPPGFTPGPSLTLRKGCLAFALGCIAILALTVAPSSSPSYNRLWNASAVVPDDLRLRDVFSRYETVRLRQLNNPESNIFTTPAGIALFVFPAPDLIGPSPARMIGFSATDSIAEILGALGHNAPGLPLAQTASTKTILKHPAPNGLNLVADPTASDPSAWIAFDGQPQFVTGIAGLPTASTALQNPAGAICPVFTSAMIPVQILKAYRLEMTVRQLLNTGATAYLAVAWYDAEGKLLQANVAQPRVAGNSRGWVNGTYSYFGLVAQAPPTSWSSFGISFGLGEAAAIPPQARFVRVGAVLNHNATPAAVVQLTDIRLFEKPAPMIHLAIPEATSVYSPASQAAQLSTHWPPQQVMIDRAGTTEIQTAAAALAPLLSP